MTNLSDYFPGKYPSSVYTPALMQLDGTSGRYALTRSSTGNVFTTTMRIKAGTTSGGGIGYVFALLAGGGDRKFYAFLVDSDHTAPESAGKFQVYVQDEDAVNLCIHVSLNRLDDGELHTIFFSFDGDNGLSTFVIDGINAIDTGHAAHVDPTVGAVANGSGTFGVGSYPGDPSSFFEGQIGFIGYKEVYLTNWEDFMEADGRPKNLDESSWAEWGGIPLIWNEHGDMINNLGSAGNMSKTGTIVVGKGGN